MYHASLVVCCHFGNFVYILLSCFYVIRNFSSDSTNQVSIINVNLILKIINW